MQNVEKELKQEALPWNISDLFHSRCLLSSPNLLVKTRYLTRKLIQLSCIPLIVIYIKYRSIFYWSLYVFLFKKQINLIPESLNLFVSVAQVTL
jgi:hypothetical protein